MGSNGSMSKIILAKAEEVKAKVNTDVLDDLSDRELGLVQTAAVIDALTTSAESIKEQATGVAVVVKQALAESEKADRAYMTEHRAEIMKGLAEIRDAVKEKKTTIDWTSLMKVGGLSGAIIGGIIGGIVYAVKVIGG